MNTYPRSAVNEMYHGNDYSNSPSNNNQIHVQLKALESRSFFIGFRAVVPKLFRAVTQIKVSFISYYPQ